MSNNTTQLKATTTQCNTDSARLVVTVYNITLSKLSVLNNNIMKLPDVMKLNTNIFCKQLSTRLKKSFSQSYSDVGPLLKVGIKHTIVM